MIIFYNNKTGKIYGTIKGRVHDEHTLTKTSIKPSEVPDEEVGKYVVPFEKIFVRKEEPVFEMIADPENPSLLKRTQVGTNITEVPNGVKIAGPFSELLSMFESGEEDTYHYKVSLDDNGDIDGFIKLSVEELAPPDKVEVKAEKQPVAGMAELASQVEKMSQTIESLSKIIQGNQTI